MPIFVQNRALPFAAAETTPLTMIDGPRAGLANLRRLAARFGAPAAARIVARSLRANRLFFCTPTAGAIACSGTLSLGFCNFYPVEPDAVVIGTIETVPESRGRGLATMAIRAAMNAMIARGFGRFYIDTQDDNVAMLRSIAKLGFLPADGPRGVRH